MIQQGDSSRKMAGVTRALGALEAQISAGDYPAEVGQALRDARLAIDELRRQLRKARERERAGVITGPAE